MMQPGQLPVMVMNTQTKREHGRKVQLGNVEATRAVADVIRTCLGPRAMLKMLMDPMGGIVMTNDGNAILREIEVVHPAAKSMIEISRTQDEEVGDGTTSVIILAGEMMSVCEPFLESKMHPTTIVAAYVQALEDLVEGCDKFARGMDINNEEEMVAVVRSCIGTKLVNKWADMACKIALRAVNTVTTESGGRREIDIKRYAKVEKIAGGKIEDSRVLDGVMFNKDVTHPKMRRRVENPRIVLLDCSLEYKKGESQTNLEIVNEDDWDKILKLEEDYVERICNDIIRLKPDVIITEKGISDLAQHYFVKAGITALRRLRKSDNLRVQRACGANIVHRTDELTEEDIGTGASLFEISKFGDEYYTFITGCKDPKACTILLRGASTDVLKEVERNLQDAMNVARNVMMDPRLLPGGGAIEMAIAHYLRQKGESIKGVRQWPYKAVGDALEVIPRTLIQNAGGNTIRTLTALRAKHASGEEGAQHFGVNGETGKVTDMRTLGVWEPYSVKVQTLKTSIETAMMLLRIDDIVSGLKRTKDTPMPEQQQQQGEDGGEEPPQA